jgi:hypothetical protein
VKNIVFFLPSSLLRFAHKTLKNRRLGDFLPYKPHRTEGSQELHKSGFLRRKVVQKPTSATGC